MIAKIENKKFVVIGGGTGTFSVLSGLKKYTDNITAVVSMADSGGSARKERDEWGLLPSSDVRKSLLALADVSNKDSLLLRQLFQYRYSQGVGVKGMTFGNLFLVALTKILKSQTAAFEAASEILRIKGKVLPVSLDKVDLAAEYDDGKIIVGEHFIDEPRHNGLLHIKRLYTKPKAAANPQVLEAISQADAIIIGPGGFYTTIIANLVINGVVEAIKSSSAKKIYILNLMTELGQTPGFTASKYLLALDQYLPTGILDFVCINSTAIPSYILNRYKRFDAQPVVNDLDQKSKYKIISADLLSKKLVKKDDGDTLQRSFVRHDPEKLVKECMKILNLI